MEISCHTWAFNDLTLREALGTIARLGFRYVDIGAGKHFNPVHTIRNPREVAADILADLRTFNLKVGDVTLMLTRISAADDKQRQTEVNVFKALVPVLKAIGAEGVTVSPGRAYPSDDEAARDRTVQSLTEMAQAAATAQLPFSIEPHLDSMATTPEAARYYLDRVPNLRLTIDWAHLLCGNAREKDIIDLLPHARHIQLRQAARAQLQLPFERGRLNIEKIIGQLYDADYQGHVCVEYLSEHKNWHGAVDVAIIPEVMRMRDAIRDARDARQPVQ